MKFRDLSAGALSLALALVLASGIFTVRDIASVRAQETGGTSPLSIAKGGTAAATAPAARTSLGLGTIATQNANGVAITGGSITGMPAPSSASDVATKNYVDSIASGIVVLASSGLATAAVLPNTPTYANGASGVGATLTAGANTTLTVDGTAAPLTTVVLVKNQASAFQNGIYTVTQAGSGAAPWILTRATYFDQAAEMKAGSYTFVSGGVANAGAAYTLQAAVTTVGTDALNWLLFSQGNVNAVIGGGAATVGDIPVISNTSTTGITDSGFSPSQIPGLVPTTATVTISNGSPGVISWAGHTLTANATIYFCTSGSLPTGLTPCVPITGVASPNTYVSNPTLYYVVGSSIVPGVSFSVATSIANAKAGTAVNTSSAGSGTHTAFANAMACAGCVGEYIYNTVQGGSPFNLSTGGPGQVWNSISLPAGIWEVGGNAGVFGTSGSTLITHMHAGIVWNFGTIPSAPFNGVVASHVNSNNSNGWMYTNNPEQIALTATTTINGVMTTDFSGGTLGAYGKIWARRR